MVKSEREKAIAAALASSERILILSHKNPDGDAIGSTLGLGLALKALGKTVHMVNVSGVPDYLGWLPCANLITTAPDKNIDYDAVAVLDCSELERTGFTPPELGDDIKGRHHIVIDHHPRDFTPSDTELVDTTAAAAGQLVYDILKLMDAPISADIATCLYMALFTDTGGFRFPNTTTETFMIAAQLTAAGAKPGDVSAMIYDREKAVRFALLGCALSTLTLSGDGKMADMQVTLDMFASTGTDGADTDGFVNYPRRIEGVEVGILFKELAEGCFRASLRSRGTVDVSAIARSFGGGGHRNASGATLDGTVAEVRAKILEQVLHALDGNGK
jgi:phosphoesterase RecJ-like protein